MIIKSYKDLLNIKNYEKVLHIDISYEKDINENMFQTILEKCINLKFLFCSFTNLTKLDLCKNQKLLHLWCNYSNIYELKVIHNKNLKKLDCNIGAKIIK